MAAASNLAETSPIAHPDRFYIGGAWIERAGYLRAMGKKLAERAADVSLIREPDMKPNPLPPVPIHR